MRLEFRLLVIDDDPRSISSATQILNDYLASEGFSLKVRIADDLTERGIRDLARQEGREYDLVVIDYNLGGLDGTNTDGATAAKKVRSQLLYTDIVFYSSDPSTNLLEKLAKQDVDGVFVAKRTDLADALKGIAKTVIRKAIDLSHMRGIVMAEVAEMDVLMEDVLERAFASTNIHLKDKAEKTAADLLSKSQLRHERLVALVDTGAVVEIATDSLLFQSSDRYSALRRIVKCLAVKPTAALNALGEYDKDILQRRNELAHAKEEVGADGKLRLRSSKRGKTPIEIDELWMTTFRMELRKRRAALSEICEALHAHLDALNSPQNSEKG